MTLVRTAPFFRAPHWFWPGILFLTGFAMTGFGQAPITNGLVARWTGDGNAKDCAGHCDGQVSGGLRYVPGPTGQAFQFNGGSSQVNFGATVGNFGARDFTIVCWLKTDSQYPHEAFLAKRATCDAASGFLEILVGGGGQPQGGILDLVMADGSYKPPYDLWSSHPMNDGQWHHIAWVRQSTSSGTVTCLIYVDGALDNTKTYPEALDLSNQSPLVLGQDVCECCDGTRAYSGAAAELQLFSHALSVEEIFTIYKAGRIEK
jgi:hypothetical protein